ncbi:MAG: Hpt domain-containing protein [Nitrosomonas sp.]|nr:Hpt domain-containing protein [Nitrosomonas sp.]
MRQMFHNNSALVCKFALKFIEVANSTLAEMKQAQAEKDLPALGRLGHKLKSSAKTIGAAGFAELCEALEKAGCDNDWNEAEVLLIKIPLLLDRITRQFQKEFGEIS